MENRNGPVVDAQVTQATGTAERETAVKMVEALGGTCKSRFVGREKLDFQLVLTMSAYNLGSHAQSGCVSMVTGKVPRGPCAWKLLFRAKWATRGTRPPTMGFECFFPVKTGSYFQ